MRTLLDPWNDADLLAQRLGQPGALLFVLLGAEQWCAKCREIRPQFDALVLQARANETWLRFDLEEHAEFLGDFLPDDLPLLVTYHGDVLLSCEVMTDADDALSLSVARARENGASKRALYANPKQRDPGIYARLLAQDWAA